ncbi:MAG TPA: ATP-binding cassette domain-containing protein, partial [Gammaproteobacteria bacterium]|nr:ATP-binding cassette domain-containing protein [Gammaproteobacteria bacterium]
MLEAIGVSKRFGDKLALDDVTLRVEPGEIYCLLGANGAGKTTLINVFLNFLAPSEGEARIDGLDVGRHPLQTKQRVAYIPEHVMLYGVLSGLENLRYFAALGTGKKASRGELLDLLATVGL